MNTAACVDPWDRRRLMRTLLLIAAAAALLLAGLTYAVVTAVTSAGASEPVQVDPALTAEGLPSGQARRDAIAAAPMLAVPPHASRSGEPAATPGPAIALPPAGKVGLEDVPTGFPKTPEGAIAQLAAIEATVLQGMSIDRAHAIHAAWSVPGAGPAHSWALVGSIQAFLGSDAGQYAKKPTTTVMATPTAAQIKGVDGADWVLACVLLDVQARVVTQARIAYGHCERMQWSTDGGGRWLIAAGPPPAPAPSTWPETDLARQAGWLTWVGSEQ